MRLSIRAAIAAIVLLGTAGLAAAHMSISPGIALANKSQKVTFGIGHGCDGTDTYKVVIDVPAGITLANVRGVYDGQFGTPVVTEDVDGIHVTWEKAAVVAADTAYYELSVRVRTPNAPFTQLQWNAHQYCVNPAGGADLAHHWIDPPGGGANGAPMMTLQPGSKLTGWNKFTLAAPIAAADLPVYFVDAQIVWVGTAAFSANPVIAEMIANTPGVTALGDIPTATDVLVKY